MSAKYYKAVLCGKLFYKDYVLTGGELPALILTDAIARLQDGVLPNSDAYSIEALAGQRLHNVRKVL